MGVPAKDFNVSASGIPQGKFGADIADYVKFVRELRNYQAKSGSPLSFTPTTRETIGFVQDLRMGKSFFDAIDTNVTQLYYDPDEQRNIQNALDGVRKRR